MADACLMVVSHSIVMPTVEYAFAPRHQKLYAYKTPSRHVLKHTITTAFLLKIGTLIKPVIARLFRTMGITAFSKKSYHKKAPHRPTKNNNQIKASRVQKMVRLKSPVLARLSDGSGATQFALKHRRKLMLRKRGKLISATSSRMEKKIPYQFCGTTKEL